MSPCLSPQDLTDMPCFGLWYLSFPSPNSSLPIVLVQVNLSFICPRNVVTELGRFWLGFYLASLVLSGLSVLGYYQCFHLEVQPLYLHSWNSLLIIDFDNDTSLSVLGLARWCKRGLSSGALKKKPRDNQWTENIEPRESSLLQQNLLCFSLDANFSWLAMPPLELSCIIDRYRIQVEWCRRTQNKLTLKLNAFKCF